MIVYRKAKYPRSANPQQGNTQTYPTANLQSDPRSGRFEGVLGTEELPCAGMWPL